MSLLPIQVPTDEEFRAVGMTGAAKDFPRSEVQIRMFAAWLGYPVDQLPNAMKYFANARTKKSWEDAEQSIRTDIANGL